MHDPQPPDVRLANPGVIGVPGEQGTDFDVQFGVREIRQNLIVVEPLGA